MFAFAEETNIRTKRNEGGKKKRSVSDTPVRPAVNMPGPVLAQSPRIVQRYPVEVMAGKVRSTPGRPAVPDTRTFLEEFYDQMKKNPYKNPFEMDYLSHYPDREEGVHALSSKGRYRLEYVLAFCHKVSIKDIENVLVNAANTGFLSTEFKEWLDLLYDGASSEVENIIEEKSIELKASLVNEMIFKINQCVGNYFLGNSQANSSIQSHPDFHIGFDQGMMSPISEHIYEHGEAMGISEPKSDGDGGAASSSVVPYWENKKRRSNVWKKREDELLRLAVSEFGDSHWIKVADFVNQHGYNRTRSECKSRWNRSLDPTINKGKWTREETERLLALVNQYGEKSWNRIALEMGNRSDTQCRYQYRSLQRKKSTSVRGRLAVTTMLSVQP